MDSVKGYKCSSLKEYKDLNELAQVTLSGLDGYTSPSYAGENIDVWSNDDKPILIAIRNKTFIDELASVGIVFSDLDKSIISYENIITAAQITEKTNKRLLEIK